MDIRHQTSDFRPPLMKGLCNMRNEKGITLVALVVSVVILIILVRVSALVLTDEDESALAKANELANVTNQILEQHDLQIAAITSTINSTTASFRLNDNDYVDPSGANEPAYISGLTPVVFGTDGTVGDVTSKKAWYNYDDNKWANAQSQDESLWVWIPRFAYKINYANSGNHGQGGSIDIVFLNGTSNKFNNNGTLTDAVSAGYTVHPCFKSAQAGNYSNGEWDKDITGLWVAKFEAGYQEGDAITPANNNKNNAVLSNVNYSSGVAYLSDAENGGTAGYNTARSYIDGVYGENIAGTLTDVTSYNLRATKISYPVFRGATYSMNYISVSDAYKLCRALVDSGNIYGFSKNTADTHLMKNSEWGAVAYLSYSKYGTNGSRLYVNNVNLNNSVSTIYGVTGYSGGSAEANPVSTIQGANIWTSEAGQMASTTHNLTGIYDLAGGTWERVSSYIVNDYTNTFGYDIARDSINTQGTSINTKYATIYNKSETDTNVTNFVQNATINGDATVETSSNGDGSTSWNSGTSMFASGELPFFARGGNFLFAGNTGLFSYGRTQGYPTYDSGFRAVIIPVSTSSTGGQ